MAQPLQPLSIAAPGFYGLNTEASATSLEANWATTANNCVIDYSGRLAARKGWAQQTTTALTGSPWVEQLFEYEKDSSTRYILSCATVSTVKKIYSSADDGAGGIATMTDRTNTITPATGNNWKFVNLNGKVHGYQQGHTPIWWDGVAAGFVDAVATSGTLPQGNDAIAALGRIWSFDSTNTVVQYSDLLLPLAWGAGSAGSIDLKSVWAYGMDKGVALAMFNGNLVIFGEKSILIYTRPDLVGTSGMYLVEHIQGTGCIARDSVQQIGTDILFLSRSGVKSLGRTIQEKSGPLEDVSKNVRTTLLTYVALEDLTKIRSVYYEKENFYILSLPTTAKVDFCFNVSNAMQDGSARITIWNGINPHSWCWSKRGNLYCGQGGVIGKYSTYLDNASTYLLEYKSPWLDLNGGQDQNISSRLKIPKKFSMIVKGNNQAVSIGLSYDYSDIVNASTIITIPSTNFPIWGTSIWGVATYSGQGLIYSGLSTPISGSGKVLQFNLNTSINNHEFSIQRLELRFILGKL